MLSLTRYTFPTTLGSYVTTKRILIHFYCSSAVRTTPPPPQKEKKRERERELVHTLKCRFMSLDLSFYTFSYTRIHCIPATKKQSVQKYF